MSGAALKTIYHNVFQPEPGNSDPAYRIKKLQNLAAASGQSAGGMIELERYLVELNGNSDPHLSDEQLTAFFWLMRGDQNCAALKPWDDTKPELW